jgi:hypothetical protein
MLQASTSSTSAWAPAIGGFLRDDFLITTAGWLTEPAGKEVWLEALQARMTLEQSWPSWEAVARPRRSGQNYPDDSASVRTQEVSAATRTNT